MISKEIPKPTIETFKNNAAAFATKWNYPNAVAAIDGKHVRIQCPSRSGSLYFNYKEYFSIVLLALVDANSRFIAIDVGSYGREGDAGIFSKSKFGQAIRSGKFEIPPPCELPGTDILLPHVILGDEAFSMHENLMKPFPRQQSLNDRTKAVYNYRHSRARRVVENAFGILSNTFRIFNQPIPVYPDTVDLAIVASCILHNILRTANISDGNEVECVSDNLMSLQASTQRNSSQSSFDIRNEFKNYFNGIGAVEWQSSYANEN